MVVWATSTPGTNFFNGNVANIGLAYYSISVFLHATLTCMVCCHCLRFASTVKKYVGEEFASPYFNIAMLLVESVLPCTLIGIAFLIAFGVGSQMEIALSRLYTVMMVRCWSKACVAGPQMFVLTSS